MTDDDWPTAAWDEDVPEDGMVTDLLSDRAIEEFDPSVGYDAGMVEPDHDREEVTTDG